MNFDLQTSDPGPYWDPAPTSSLDEDVRSAVLHDDHWEFGQVVTVALLLVPLFSFSESIYGMYE